MALEQKERASGDRHDFRVTSGTPMGDALRRYWTPVCLISDVAEPDCDPVRVWALGQPFVVFRDTAGRVGILDEACPHRKVSLVYGRNEKGGLRCLWHQWKIAVDGTLLETPNNDDCRFRERVRANAYDVYEAGGLVWGYFGPKELKPPFPWLPWFDVPLQHVKLTAADLDNNFVRNIEALVDSTHATLLHADAMTVFLPVRAEERDAFVADTTPKIDTFPTEYGFRYAAIRNSSPGVKQVRVTSFVAPYLGVIGSPPDEGQCHISIPQDDTHSRLYSIVWRYDRALTKADHEYYTKLLGTSDEQLDRHGLRVIMPDVGPLGKRNHFSQDREAMRRGETYSGHLGLTAEDGAMTSSLVGIADYRGENLIPADLGIAKLRRALVDIQGQASAGEAPIGSQGITDKAQVYGLVFDMDAEANWRTELTARAAKVYGPLSTGAPEMARASALHS